MPLTSVIFKLEFSQLSLAFASVFPIHFILSVRFCSAELSCSPYLENSRLLSLASAASSALSARVSSSSFFGSARKYLCLLPLFFACIKASLCLGHWAGQFGCFIEGSGP